MLADCLGKSVTRRLAVECHAVSGGIPLLVKALAEDYRACANPRLPRLVFGRAFDLATMAFLSRCEPTVMQVAQAAALLGNTASAALVADLLDMSEGLAAQGLNALNTVGLLVGSEFRHHAVRSTVLDFMMAKDRAELDRRAARGLHNHGAAASILVRHFLAADRIDVPEAAPLLRKAAEQALAAGKVSVAIRYLRRAEEECSDSAQRAATKFMLTQAQWRVDPASASRHLPDLVAAVREGDLGPGYAPALLPYLIWQGQTNEAAEALALLDQSADSNGALPSPGPRPTAPRVTADFRAGQLWLDCSYPGRAERIRTGPHAWATPLAALPGTPWTLKGPEQILQKSRLDDCTLPPIVAALAGLICADQPDRAGHWCRLLLDDANDRGFPTWQAVFRTFSAMIENRRGNLPVAEEHAHTALSLLSTRGWGVPIGAPLAAMLLATTAAGKLEQAESYLRIPVPDEMFQTPWGLMYLRARGRYYLSTNRPHAALTDFQSCGERMIAWELDLPAMLPWRSEAAQAHLRMGQVTEARGLVNEQLAHGKLQVTVSTVEQHLTRVYRKLRVNRRTGLSARLSV